MSKSTATSASLRNYRACMVCSLCQPTSAFTAHGCPNCEDFLELKGSADAIQDCTSAVFEGVVAMSDPEGSWVAKWQRLQGYVPGIYAVKVVGVLPEDYVNAAESAGVKYIPRDGSAASDDQ